MPEGWDVNLNIEEAISSAFGELADDWRNAVVATIPQKTGETAGTIEANASMSSIEIEGSKIAEYLATGTEPHPIDVRTAKVLYSAETDTYFGKHVDHPGTGPNDYLERAIDAEEEHTLEVIGNYIGAQWSGTP